MCGSECRSPNHALNLYPISELESEKAKIQVQRHKIGNVSRKVFTELHELHELSPLSYMTVKVKAKGSSR